MFSLAVIPMFQYKLEAFLNLIILLFFLKKNIYKYHLNKSKAPHLNSFFYFNFNPGCGKKVLNS